jgi:rhomboid family GlyGly-CTERM serine protease
MTRFLTKFTYSWQSLTIVTLVTIVALLAFIFDQQLSETLVYQRGLIAQGEVWRLITGHFLHTNGYHLSMNLAALILLCLLHGKFYNIKNYSLLFLFSTLFCSAALYIFDPKLIQYVGLSGVLHGIFVWGALMDILKQDKTGYLLLCGVIVKIIHEQLYGASTDLMSLIDANVAISAHLWGAIAGLVFFFSYSYKRLITKKTT